MNTTSDSSESVLTTDPSDLYAITPEIQPKPVSRSDDHEEAPDGKIGKNADFPIDGDAYNQLTKPDPHWATIIAPADVRGERWETDFLYLDKEHYFEMLSEINRGEKNGPTWEHSELQTYRLRKFIVKNLGQQLNMTDQQIKQATARATNVDGEKFGQQLELAVFCTCAYVVHRDETGYAKNRHYHPNRDENDELFESVAARFDLDQNRIEKVCRKFDQEFDELPPYQFDSRKPNWKEGEHPEGQIVASPSVEERRGHRWTGGI